MTATTRFACPACGAKYALVKMEDAETEAVAPNGQLACRSCGGPLDSYEGRFILKYFLVDPPRRRERLWLTERPQVVEQQRSPRPAAAKR